MSIGHVEKSQARGGRITKSKSLISLAIATYLCLVFREVLNGLTGSGSFLFGLSVTWVILLSVFLLGISALWLVITGMLLRPWLFDDLVDSILQLRVRLGLFRWPLVVLLTATNVWFVYYSTIGMLFLHGALLRSFLFLGSIIVLAFLLDGTQGHLIGLQSLLLATILFGTSFLLATQLEQVTAYHFKLFWSEGNRLYDYSKVFGSSIYTLPNDQSLQAGFDLGRSLLWGIPFLLPLKPSVVFIRAWDIAVVVVPYIAFGLFATWPLRTKPRLWYGFGLWTMLFLWQGPIYTPLILGVLFLLIGARFGTKFFIVSWLVASAYVLTSRFTWMFAPAIWLFILVIIGQELSNRRFAIRSWRRAVMLVCGALMAGVASIHLLHLYYVARRGIEPGVFRIAGSLLKSIVWFYEFIMLRIGNQPLLWSRLLPNESYPPGILLSLLIATGPVILILANLVGTRKWPLSGFQIAIVVLGLAAFLVVGLVISTKIGGGLDLHNLDMFLVTLVLLAAIALQQGFAENFETWTSSSGALRGLVLAAVMIPAFIPVLNAAPLILPSKEIADQALADVQEYVACAKSHGDVLFMDERQLITFGHVDVILIQEYEKKHVMDQAMEGDAGYFKGFYEDLANDRFSLIVLDPQKVLIKDDDESLSEENNAWTNWVTKPLLQEYESVYLNSDVKVELFMPIGRDYTCP